VSERFDILARARSFVYAFRGIGQLFVREHNARIHAAVGAAVIGLGLFLGVSRIEWSVLTLTIACVLCAEAMNSAVEALADALHPDPHPMIARAKDVAAAGVLLTAMGAAVVGLLVLGPPLWQRIFDG
jgi:diacylglycerol kinase